jgi:hypothetical protein
MHMDDDDFKRALQFGTEHERHVLVLRTVATLMERVQRLEERVSELEKRDEKRDEKRE